MSKNLRIGVIGTGKIARRHLASLKQVKDVEIVAHLGRQADSADRAAAEWGGAPFTDLDEFCERGGCDAVFVTVPPAAHGTIEIALIDGKIPFLVEKPLSVPPEVAEPIAIEIERSGLLVAVGFQWRALDFLPLVHEFLPDHPIRMILGQYHGSTPSTPWWRKRAESGGQFVEQACHVVDLARHLAGEAQMVGARSNHSPLPVYPDADIAGATAALVEFGNQVPGVFTTTCVLDGPGGARLTLICDGAEIGIGLDALTIRRGGETKTWTPREHPALVQNRRFLDAVRHGDASLLACSYAEVMGTHRLCAAIAAR